jgi:hypothetical protein
MFVKGCSVTVATLALMLCSGLSAQVTSQQPGQPSPGAELSNKKKEKGQDTSVRSLEGTVRDANENPVSGAVVKLKDTKTLTVRSFITAADGTYRFHGLSKNVNYEVKADYNQTSSGTRTLSVFDDRPRPIINLKLQPKS